MKYYTPSFYRYSPHQEVSFFGTGFKPAIALQQILMPFDRAGYKKIYIKRYCAGLLTATFAAESERNAVQRNAHRRVYGVPAPS
jgi:hypothetical protein